MDAFGLPKQDKIPEGGEIIKLTVTPNQWSQVMTLEGVYYAQVPYAGAKENMQITHVKNLVNFSDTLITGVSAGSLTILKAKVYDGEFIFFASIRPEEPVNLELTVAPKKSKIILA